MRRRRVLHVHRDFAPDRGGGGVARHIHGLATTTAGLGYDVRVVAPGAIAPTGTPDYEVRTDAGLGLWRHVGWADIVHVHGSRNPIAAMTAAIAGLRGKALIYTPHCYYDDDAALKQAAKRLWDMIVERPLLAGSDAVVLLAEFWRDELGTRGLRTHVPVILPNCVLAQAQVFEAAPPRKLDGHPALLSVGRLDPVKRLDDAIMALGRDELVGAVLHIVGLGPDRDRLRDVASRAGVTDRVRFHGFVADEDVAAMAAAADGFVLASAAEGGPTVLIEMLLAGCRIVASDIPANRAILAAAGWTDGLYPLGDIAALAATAQGMTGQRLPAEVTARARAAFTWDCRTAQILALYENAWSRAARGAVAPAVGETE